MGVHDYTYGFTVIDVETGDEVDPMTIIAPTAVARQDDVLDVLDADLVVDSNVELESGSLTWKEVAVDGKSRSSCARSDHDEKRAKSLLLPMGLSPSVLPQPQQLLKLQQQ